MTTGLQEFQVAARSQVDNFRLEHEFGVGTAEFQREAKNLLMQIDIGKALAAADDVRTKISTFDKVPAGNVDSIMQRGKYASH